MNKPYRVAIFASGTGSNAIKIIEHLAEKATFKIYSNKIDAPILEKAKLLQVPTFVFGRVECYQTNKLLEDLESFAPDLIVLAGFLWLMPSNIIKAYPHKIINIHPALLPKFGGKGMYGMNVHQAVINAREKQSGITIHYVTENYDEGAPILQVSCQVDSQDTPETLAKKVQALEHRYLPTIVEKLLVEYKNNLKMDFL